MTGPYFSVIVPAYNRAHVVLRAVHSVLGQTFGDFELIVVDDAGADETEQVLATVDDPRLRYVRRDRNGGMSAARNTGVEHAQGLFLTFLDSDDEAMPTWLETFAAVLDPVDRPVARCGMLRLGPDGFVRRIIWPAPPERFERWMNAFLAGTYALRRDVLDEAGGYCPDISFGANSELSLRIAELAERYGWEVPVVRAPRVRYFHNSRVIPREARMQMTAYVLERHDRFLQRHRSTRATYLGFLGASQAVLGDTGAARHTLLDAWLAAPLRPRSAVRLAAAWVPALGRVVWHAPSPTADTAHTSATRTGQAPPFTFRRPHGLPRSVSVILLASSGDAATVKRQLEALSGPASDGMGPGPRGGGVPWEVLVAAPAGLELTEPAGGWAPGLSFVWLVLDAGRGTHLRNAAAAAAGGDFFVFCRSTDQLPAGWLRAMVDAAPSADLVTGLVGIEGEPWAQDAADRELRAQPWDGGLLPFDLGSNAGIWRDAWHWTGGWNAALPAPVDDVELFWRAQLCGYRLGVAPGARVRRPADGGHSARGDHGLTRAEWKAAHAHPKLYAEMRLGGAPRPSAGALLRLGTHRIQTALAPWGSPETRAGGRQ